jgi:hypothetical protein
VVDAPADGADLAPLQRAVDQANAELSERLQTLEATHLRAVSDATVAQVLVQPGEPIEPTKPAVMLARSPEAVVRVNLLDGDKPKRVQAGQPVKVRLDGSDAQFDGGVVDFAPPAANGDRIALVRVNWASVRPAVGTGARASITIGQKDSALIAPRRAVKRAGNRTYIEVVDGQTRTSIPVEIGITSVADVEIIGGVAEGQAIAIDSVLESPANNQPDLPRAPAPLPTSGPATSPPSAYAPPAT